MLTTFLQLRLLLHMTKSFSFLLSRLCTRSTIDDPILLSLLCKNLCAILMLFLEWEYLRRRFVLNKFVLNKYYFFELFEKHFEFICSCLYT
jgi:hypothetical protein